MGFVEQRRNKSYYSLVMAVAKRAREIVLEADARGEKIVSKPVKLALDELKEGKFDYTIRV